MVSRTTLEGKDERSKCTSPGIAKDSILPGLYLTHSPSGKQTATGHTTGMEMQVHGQE